MGNFKKYIDMESANWIWGFSELVHWVTDCKYELNYLNRIFFHTFLKIFHSMEKAAKGTEYSKNHQKNSVNNRLELGI